MKAFPGMDIRAQYEGDWADKFLVPFTGMDLRDYFAAKVMPILIEFYPDEDGITNPVVVARKSYLYADAMMKARNQNE